MRAWPALVAAAAAILCAASGANPARSADGVAPGAPGAATCVAIGAASGGASGLALQVSPAGLVPAQDEVWSAEGLAVGDARNGVGGVEEGAGFTGAPSFMLATQGIDVPRRRRASTPASPARERPRAGLGPERAQVLLRSLTVPGWGEATLGRRTSALVFALAEVGVWGSFTAFRVQEQMRRDAYERTARLRAGIDLRGRDEEFRRIVGSYASSDEYNLLVVYRDAANLYYDDPVAFRRYVGEHELGGADSWAWPDEESFLRYRGQRKDAQRAARRANTVLAVAVVNRLVSAVHAGRASAAGAGRARSWRFEAVPVPGTDPTAFQLGVRARF